MTPRIAPVCPSTTADVVAFLRAVVDEVCERGFRAPSGERLVEHLCDKVSVGLRDVPVGISLLMLTLSEVADSDLRTISPYNVTPFVFDTLRYCAVFQSIDEALGRHLPREYPGRDPRFVEEMTLNYLAAIVVDRRIERKGQLSHPSDLAEEFEKGAVATATINDRDVPNFLRALEQACLRAHRAGCPAAAVLVRDTVSSCGRGIEFESLFASDRDTLDVEAVRRGNVGSFIHIEVRQQEAPGGRRP